MARSAKTSTAQRTIECDLCKTGGIKWGAIVCRGCGADIIYENFSKTRREGNITFALVVGSVAALVIVFVLMMIAMMLIKWGAPTQIGFIAYGSAFLITPLAWWYVWRNSGEVLVGPDLIIPSFRKPRTTFVGVTMTSGD